MPNVELVRAISIYYNMFKFQVDRIEPLFFELSCAQTDRQTTHRQTDGHEYSIVAVNKHKHTHMRMYTQAHTHTHTHTHTEQTNRQTEIITIVAVDKQQTINKSLD